MYYFLHSTPLRPALLNTLCSSCSALLSIFNALFALILSNILAPLWSTPFYPSCLHSLPIQSTLLVTLSSDCSTLLADQLWSLRSCSALLDLASTDQSDHHSLDNIALLCSALSFAPLEILNYFKITRLILVCTITSKFSTILRKTWLLSLSVECSLRPATLQASLCWATILTHIFPSLWWSRTKLILKFAQNQISPASRHRKTMT